MTDLTKSTIRTWAVGAILTVAIGFVWRISEYVHSVDKRLTRIEYKLGIDVSEPHASKE